MRSIGLRLAFLGAAAALLAALGIYAQFTDSDTGSGSVGAGTVEVKIGTTLGNAEEDFTVIYDGTCLDTSNMVAGETCTAGGVKVFNTGSLTFTYTVEPFVMSQNPAVPPAYPDCWDISLVGPTNFGDTAFEIPPGESETWTINVTMLSNNDCQGMEAVLGMRANATQAP